VHDTVWFESQGMPAVFVASSVFEHAADAQARALGLPSVRRVFVPHPIQDATDDEMRRKADAIVDEVVVALTGPTQEPRDG
jgi:alkanesulfonate monooxygenase SsuD/methylene tetrahydromethanopterin reductase-like flavin-dependent oxidoreductase (luciferase family)